jgi:membrane-bound serine protease (ClpP class)
VLDQPDLVFLLLMLGLAGLALEAVNPGGIVPGVVGVIALALAVPGLIALPIGWMGVLLLGIGVALFVIEVLVGGRGIPAAAGIAAFATGGVLLFDSPDPAQQTTPALAVLTAVAIAGGCALVARRVRAARGARVVTGAAAMVGMGGSARGDVSPLGGHVQVNGEIWDARTARGTVRNGAPVRVVEVNADELTLVVERGGVE